MLISKVISELQRIQDSNGDLQVVIRHPNADWDLMQVNGWKGNTTVEEVQVINNWDKEGSGKKAVTFYM